MADAATRWICPYFESLQPPNFTRVWVLNPGAADAKVETHWYDAVTGQQVGLDEQTVVHGTTYIFVAGTMEDAGWLRIASDQPVVPWGTTPIDTFNLPGLFAPMSFYREDALGLDKLHVPVKIAEAVS